MSISVPTLILVTTIVTFTTSMLLAISWLQNPSERCLFYWAAANLVGTIAALLFGQRSLGLDFLTIHGANIALFVSGGLAWCGMREFTRQGFSLYVVVIAPALWIALAIATPFAASMIARTIFSSAVVSTFAFAAAFSLWSHKTEKLMSRYPAIIVCAVHGLFYVARIPAVLVMGVNDQRDLFAAPVITPVALETLIYVVMISFLRIALVKERAESVSRRAVATDQLTGVASRRAFFEDGQPMLSHCLLKSEQCSVVLIDLDHFKSINDRYGHAVGDAVLQEFSRRAQNVIGQRGLFARLGGEEFAAIMPNVPQEQAFELANAIMQDTAAAAFEAEDVTLKLTISIGMAFSHRSGYDLDRLLRHADKALYCAKNNGRDRIECAVVEDNGITRFAA